MSFVSIWLHLGRLAGVKSPQGAQLEKAAHVWILMEAWVLPGPEPQ